MISKEEKASYTKALEKSKGNVTEAAKILGIPRTTFARKCQDVEIESFYKKIKKGRRYVFTSAQNATPIHKKFFDSLMVYCEENNAQLIIIPLRYRNVTSVWSHKNEGADWWDDNIKPYLCDSRFEVNNNLIVLADIKTQPTAVDPLSGFESISGEKSAIFGHTKLALKTVPVTTGGTPKIICTTGSITQSNYTDSKAGKKGEFHHTNAAQVVEVFGDNFHIRQLNACTDGSFIDLQCEYTPKGVFTAGRPDLVLGDWHDFAHDPVVLKATFTNKNSIVKTLNPRRIVWHDALDFYSKNHHHRGNPFLNIAKHRAGINDVKEEVEIMFKRIEKLAGGRLSIFPASNHPDALARWTREADWKTDPVNAAFYLETALAMVKSSHMKGHLSHVIDPFEYWGEKLLRYPNNFIFLSRSDSFKIRDIVVDMHGDKGSGGARGSIISFAKLGVKSVVGHRHGSGIRDGCYQVGTSSHLQLEYNAGLSGWLQTHCLIYANGKRSLINIIEGQHTL